MVLIKRRTEWPGMMLITSSLSENILKPIITKPAVFDLIALAGIEFASGRELSAGSGVHSCIRRESQNTIQVSFVR